ncbi:MAG: hypothetical protein SGJ20_08200 [Planctomycetota bacterium]|nr:hypothetical protein [Planctomycetota bacterium]
MLLLMREPEGSSWRFRRKQLLDARASFQFFVMAYFGRVFISIDWLKQTSSVAGVERRKKSMLRPTSLPVARSGNRLNLGRSCQLKIHRDEVLGQSSMTAIPDIPSGHLKKPNGHPVVTGRLADGN